MTNIIVEITKYSLILLMTFYTFLSFRVLVMKNTKVRENRYRMMSLLMYLIHGVSFISLYITSNNIEVIFLYLAQLVVFIITGFLYKVSYKRMSQLVYRNMMTLLMFGFVMIARLSFQKGVRQFIIASIALAVCLVVPMLIDRVQLWGKLSFLYGIIGLIILLFVYLFGKDIYGARNWIVIGNFSIQPSEFVKILFIFFVASVLSKRHDFKRVVFVTILAAAHVLVLVLEKDLGGALLFFFTYIIMLYCATGKLFYLISGISFGALSSVVAFQMFSHVRVRVTAFLDPFAVIEKEGYQVAQSLFAIGTGGFTGMGLNRGLPTSIPVAESDFIFSALSEEYGAIVGICLILICLSCFIMFVNISVKFENPFYKLTALGLSTMYISQVFLNIGGAIKCIPSTGVTLPLLSYGGSSVISSIIVFSIIQGMYVLHMRSEEELKRAQAMMAQRLAKRKLAAEKKREQEKLSSKSSKKGSSAENSVKSAPTATRSRFSKKDDNQGAEANVVYRDKKAYNRSIYSLTYIFSFLLFLVIGYYSYFLVAQGKTFVNNAYNKRQDLLAQYIEQGKILSSDGAVLAQTITNDAGAEIRVYPYGSVFSHAVGRVLHGRTGIEQSESFTMITSSVSGFGKLTNTLNGVKTAGDNVVSTLNAKLQQVAYDALGDYRGAVVVLEPSTGKILAMVSKPDYNPNTITEKWESLNKDQSSPLLNRATQGLYPPGSTFKILTALEYMRENPNYEDYEYKCKSEDRINDVTIHCANGSSHGKENLKESFANSCNTSFANLGSSLNMDSFRSLCESMLFNKTLPTSFKTAQSSFVLNSQSNPNDFAQTVIGLGKTQISPLHNAMIAATVANGGLMMKPYLVDRVETFDGRIVKRYSPDSYGQVISKKEAEIMSDYMKEVVKNGTGTRLSGMKVSVAGKTGTADYEIGKPSHAWFVGFAPVENPQIAISVIVESSGTGSKYAVPIAKKIIEAYFK
ncbi:FtsW/RodA/SpoVE family cell cycle protein [Lachnoclostridium phytofermentans]|uniref:Penicillin-binding protein transpeptidase n=1 Tax=Lachnoclostridium phytofermentans (strain ATCC 700394 / DSM 18823 / ISDg) TaxID=357809 RepID=A9KP52_LACP7|nr:FtsW/RodA/SpoVE family cell cycle protein [Lachnoclostridium phytofermentans]ABX41714.1 penicillin-binding protein transpeptidase [Lachnoclostridium phytofermentans ISDg]